MKLSTWAKENGITYQTALNWFHNGTMPVPTSQLKNKTILVHPVDNNHNILPKTIIYTRVSSYQNKNNLNRQVELCENFCAANGTKVHEVVKEVASGINDNRPKLNKILDQNNINLVVLYKDRLTRFGFSYINRIIEARGGKIILINASIGDEDDIMKDFVDIMTSFCCRLYGARRGQNKVKKIKDLVAE